MTGADSRKPDAGRVILKIPRRSFLFHPLSLFLGVWGAVVLLYSMHLSYLLIFSTSLVLRTSLWIVVPFVATIVLCIACGELLTVPRPKIGQVVSFTAVELTAIDRLLRRAFGIWSVLSVVEIVVSGGLPIIWLIRGSSKTYFDFGIPSVHGLLNSLLLSLGVCQIAFYAIDGKKKRLLIPGFIVMWSAIVMTRNLMMVMMIEGAIIWVLLRGFSWSKVMKSFAALAILVLIFGYVGDFRSGADTFRGLAQPTEDYPAWLPSGVLWGYIYLTTPVGNVVNTAISEKPVDSFRFPNTTSLLFPTVLRNILYGNGTASEAFSGNLVTDAFNVSTAYIGPFQDFGYVGMVCFSALLALISYLSWSVYSFKGVANFAVIGQCVVLSVFFNHLFYLPVITQVLWLHLFLRRTDHASGGKIA